MTSPAAERETEGVYLIEERPNPSTDYFVLPAVSSPGVRVERCGFRDLPSPGDLVGATVVFVRYVPPAWTRLLDRANPALRRLVLFVDDDVLDIGATAGMPWRYRFKLARLAAWKQRWLRRKQAELWVATDYLQRKYADWRPRLVRPMPAASSEEVCRVFYHGSASHGAEIRWLRRVMADVLRRNNRVVFEIIGGKDVYRLFRMLPRVTVVHPMRWAAYQAFLAMPGRHVGLAPLLDVPFNRARSCTKFFDITRCGAVGVYAGDGAYAEVVRNGVEGLIVEQDPAAWAEAILRLAHDEPLRKTMLRNAQERFTTLTEQARQSYAALRDRSDEQGR